jgi:hypothetical protein
MDGHDTKQNYKLNVLNVNSLQPYRYNHYRYNRFCYNNK